MSSRSSREGPYLYLIYLAFLAFLGFQPIFDPDAGAGDWLIAAALAGIFLPLFLWGYRQRGRKLLWSVAGMTLLGTVGVVLNLNSGATTFFIYAAAGAARVGSVRTAWTIIGILFMIATGTFFFSEVPFPFRWAAFIPAFLFIPTIGGLQIVEAERSRSDARLRLAQEEMERLAVLAERERIARDLHDLLGHTLSLITLKSELATRLASSDPDRAAGEMAEVEAISREALAQVREAVQGYRAQGLSGEIANAKLALTAADIDFDIRVEPVELSPRQEGTLALVLREGVTNIVRHSQATRAEVALRTEGDEVLLALADNGRGGGAEGNGLAGIRERVRSLGGHFSRTMETGTTLTVGIPSWEQRALGAEWPPPTLKVQPQ